jgi:predicted RNA binding protein YcfA (HicA-like mRNA interferase family)
MKSSDLIKNLMNMGWYLHRIKGSHHHFRHPALKGLVTVPHPAQELPKGTVKSIMRQAGASMTLNQSSSLGMEKNIDITASCY